MPEQELPFHIFPTRTVNTQLLRLLQQKSFSDIAPIKTALKIAADKPGGLEKLLFMTFLPNPVEPTISVDLLANLTKDRLDARVKEELPTIDPKTILRFLKKNRLFFDPAPSPKFRGASRVRLFERLLGGKSTPLRGFRIKREIGPILGLFLAAILGGTGATKLFGTGDTANA